MLCCLSASATEPSELPADTLLPGVRADQIAIYIEDLISGEVLADVNAELPMIPASVTKLVTAATVMQCVSLDTCYTTDIVVAGSICDSILRGNIVVKACGDPTIESAYFPDRKGLADSIAANIARLGIRQITGRILIDTPEWLCEAIPSGWEKADVVYPYGTDHHALNYADNRFSLTCHSPRKYTVSPETPDVNFRFIAGKNSIHRNPGETAYTICHKGRKPLSTSLANPLPESSLRRAIEIRLADLGIEIDSLEVTRPKGEISVYRHVSPSVCQILKSMILRSDNLMAEGMLRFALPGMPRSVATSKEIEDWTDREVNMADVYLEDGSGLSRKNRLTAYALADLLIWLFEKEPQFPRFLDMLPQAGRTGTLKSFLKDTPLEGRLWAKTGSMSGVQSYAGFIVDLHGCPTHVVVIMVNGLRSDRGSLKTALADLLMEKLLPADNCEEQDMFD